MIDVDAPVAYYLEGVVPQGTLDHAPEIVASVLQSRGFQLNGHDWVYSSSNGDHWVIKTGMHDYFQLHGWKLDGLYLFCEGTLEQMMKKFDQLRR